MNKPKVIVHQTASLDGRLAIAREKPLLFGDERWQAFETIFDLDTAQFMVRTCDETRAILRYFSLPEIIPEHIMQLEEIPLCGGG